MAVSLYIIRHGETDWSSSGRHTGRSDIPLSAQGEARARRLTDILAAVRFTGVLASPRQRAQRTCELAGMASGARTEPDLAEWDYGDYEGMRSAEILKERPGWNLFRDGCPGGESPADVSARADRLIARLRTAEGALALFTHGHFGRVLAVRWVGLPVSAGESLLLDTASVGILTYEHGNPAAPAIGLWNFPPSGRIG